MAEHDAQLDAGLAKAVRDAAETMRVAVANCRNAGLSVQLNLTNGSAWDQLGDKVDPKAVRVWREL